MAINWPSIAQGTGTGTTYTSPAPNSNLWIWSGYSWGSTGTTANGGFGGPWVIFNRYGKARAYSDLPSAVSNSIAGDTIHLFQNITEYPTINSYIQLNKNLNLNLNGYTYTLDVRSTDYIYTLITNYNAEVKIRMYNGKIECINSGISTVVIEEFGIPSPSVGCDWHFDDIIISKNSGSRGVCKFISSVTGGVFKDSSPSGSNEALTLFSVFRSSKKYNIFRNCVAISENNVAIQLLGNATDLITLCINCKGFSNAYNESEDVPAIAAVSSTSYGNSNRFRLINCEGINTAGQSNGDTSQNANRSSGINVSQSITLINCRGKSVSGDGIKTERSNLIHCIGLGGNDSEGSSFFSKGGSNTFKRCSSNLGEENPSLVGHIGLKVLATNYGGSATFDNLDNCYIDSNFGINVLGTSYSSNYIRVSNSNFKYVDRIIYSTIAVTKEFELLNSTFIPDETVFPFTSAPIMTLSNQSVFANNVIVGPSGSSGYTYCIQPNNSTMTQQWMSNNTTINFLALYDPTNVTQRVIDNADSQNNISWDPYRA